MYKKIILIVLVLLVIVRSEETSAKNVTRANFLNFRLSTILPYLSLHNDQNLTKNNEKRSLYFIPPSQIRDEYKKPKEISQKTKRCGSLPRKNKFSSSSRKDSSNRAEMNTRNLDKNIKISKQNSRILAKNVRYLQENPANRIKAETHKDTFLRAVKNNLDAENSESRGKIKKNDKENCICYCKEENCASKSSIKNSSEILSSSRKDKPEKTNHQQLAKEKNTKSNVLRTSPRLYHKSFPSSINSFPTRLYQEKVHDIPRVAILYGKSPNILPYIVGNEKKFVPFTTFENRSNFLAKNNQYPLTIRQNSNPCPRKDEENRVGNPVISTTSSITQMESDLQSTTEKDQEDFFKPTTETSTDRVDVSTDSKMETNFYPNYSNEIGEKNRIMDFSNSDEATDKLDDSTESIDGNRDDDFSKLMSSSINNVDRSEISPTIYPSIMRDEKLINMEECIKLFGRDVCVLSASSVTSPEALSRQAQKNSMNEYSTITIPEYIVRMSAKEETTSNNVDYSDEFRTTEVSNVDSNEYLESTSTELTDENFLRKEFYAGSIEYTGEPNDDYDENKLFNSEEDTLVPMKKLMYRITDKKTAKNTQLGKGKSHKIESLSSSNNKETTTIGYNFQTGHHLEEESTNRLIGSEIDFDPEDETLKKQFKEEIRNEEETTENDLLGIKTFKLGDEIFQGLEVQNLDHEGTDYLNNNEDVTDSLETIIDSSERLPFHDNTLLLNSIRKVINDFASNVSLAKAKNLDENILQTQGSNLLPEILKLSNLESILLIPQIENMIIEKVSDILSNIEATSRGYFTTDWSHDVIRNTLRSLLQALSSGFHRKLPSIEEHQFKDGQWTVNSVTLAPVSNKKASLTSPENLRQSIGNLLTAPAIASQMDHYIVQNMIVQSVKNSFAKNEQEKIEDLIIHELNDIFRTLKDSADTNVLGKNSEFIDSERDVDLTYSQEISTNDYEKGINIGNLVSIDEENPDIENSTEIDNENMSIYKMNENVTDTLLNGILKINNIQDDEVKGKLAEPSKIAVTYHKAISQNNLGIISAISIKPNLEELSEKAENVLTTTISSITAKNVDETEKSIVNPTSRIKDTNDDNKSLTNRYSLNNSILKCIENDYANDKNIQVATIPSNFMQKTSPKISDGIITKNMMEVKDIGDEYITNKELLTKSTDSLMSPTNVKLKIVSSTDEIDPAIILERIEHNSSPIKYYSPEILKYIKSHRNDNNNDDDINIEITTTSFMQDMSDNVIKLHDKTLNTSIDDIISSPNIEYGNYEINKDILDSQQHNFVTKGNVIDKIHEVTTEVQRTYTKTRYFKVNSSDDNLGIGSSLSTYNTNSNNKDKNSDNHNANLIGNKMYNTDNTETNEQALISCPKSCVLGNIYPLQLFPSDSIKLPVEIEKLKDGSYALSITKNICEQILERKCSCCLPVQGHLILSCNKNQDQKENTHIITDKNQNQKDNAHMITDKNQDQKNMMTLMTTGKNALRVQKSVEAKRMRAHDLSKRNLNDNNLITILMPVIDFAKKYLLDSNKTDDIMQNYDKSLRKSTGEFDDHQLKERNLNDIFTTKEEEFTIKNKDATDKLQKSVNLRERKDINFPRSSISRDYHNSENSIEIESQEKHFKANQYKITEDLRKSETEKNIQNINTERKINLKNQKRHPILKRINMSKEDTEIKNEEIKSNKYQIADVEKGNVKVFRKKKDKKPRQTIVSENHERIPISRIIISRNKDNVESDEETNWDKSIDIGEGDIYHTKKKDEYKMYMMNDNHNIPRIKTYEEVNKKPYRSQRNANNVANKRVELVKSVLYWLKDILLD